MTVTRSQRSLPDDVKQSENKRARIDRHQRPHDQPESINQSDNECELLRYSFLISIVLTFLNDRTALGRLLHVCKSMEKHMIGYALKKQVKVEKALDLICDSRYLPVIITHLSDVKGEDLSAFTNLTSVHFSHHYTGAIKLPDTITDLKLSGWNSPVTHDTFPCQLKRLQLGLSFNQPIGPGMLPASITELNFERRFASFNQLLLPGTLPAGLVKLVLPSPYGVLPDTLESLVTSSPISCPLPRSLRKLSLTNDGVIDASFLPDTLTDLSLDLWLLVGPLSSSIVNLSVGSTAGLDIVGLNTSTTMTHLELFCVEEDEDRVPIRPGQLPPCITHLVTSLECLPAAGAIPDSVTHLEFFENNFVMEPGIIPNSVTHLTFRLCDLVLKRDAIPGSVVDLRIDTYDGVLEAGVIPSSVRTLHLDKVGQPLQVGVIPASVETLVFCSGFNQSLHVGIIPPSVTKLILRGPIKQPLMSMSLPLSQAEVTQSGGRITHFTARSIPNSVVELQCHWSDDVPVPVGAIPDSVTKLSFGGTAYDGMYRYGPKTQLLVVGSIPSSVTELDMGPHYNAAISAGIIPASLQRLKLGSSFRQTLPPEWTDNPACYRSD